MQLVLCLLWGKGEGGSLERRKADRREAGFKVVSWDDWGIVSWFLQHKIHSGFLFVSFFLASRSSGLDSTDTKGCFRPKWDCSSITPTSSRDSKLLTRRVWLRIPACPGTAPGTDSVGSPGLAAFLLSPSETPRLQHQRGAQHSHSIRSHNGVGAPCRQVPDLTWEVFPLSVLLRQSLCVHETASPYYSFPRRRGNTRKGEGLHLDEMKQSLAHGSRHLAQGVPGSQGSFRTPGEGAVSRGPPHSRLGLLAGMSGALRTPAPRCSLSSRAPAPHVGLNSAHKTVHVCRGCSFTAPRGKGAEEEKRGTRTFSERMGLSYTH